MDWVNSRIKSYLRDGVQQIKDFTESFRDGTALSAIVDSISPGVIDFKSLVRTDLMYLRYKRVNVNDYMRSKW